MQLHAWGHGSLLENSRSAWGWAATPKGVFQRLVPNSQKYSVTWTSVFTSASIRPLWVKNELHWKANLPIYQLIHVPNHTCANELWVATDKAQLWIRMAEMSFCPRVQPPHRVRGSDMWRDQSGPTKPNHWGEECQEYPAQPTTAATQPQIIRKDAEISFNCKKSLAEAVFISLRS